MRSTIALAVLLLAATAHADDVALAAKFFEEGKSAYARGDNGAAALAFEEADRHAPRGATIFNAAVAWEAAGDLPRAADDYAVADARTDLDDKMRANAKAHLAKLEADVGRLSLRGPASARVSVEHVSGAALPIVVHVRPGAHEVRVVFSDGKTNTRTMTVEKGATASLEIEAPPETTTTTTEAPPDVKPEPKAEPAEPSRATRTWGLVALGGAVVAGGAALFLGSRALSARDEFDASAHTDGDARDRAAGLRTWTNVAWVSAGVLAVTGVVLVLLPARSTSGGATTVGLSPGFVSLATSF